MLYDKNQNDSNPNLCLKNILAAKGRREPREREIKNVGCRREVFLAASDVVSP